MLVWRADGYELDARAVEPKDDGCSARMIRARHQQYALDAAPGQLPSQRDSFIDGRPGIVQKVLK
jgi:hypothetical protein